MRLQIRRSYYTIGIYINGFLHSRWLFYPCSLISLQNCGKWGKRNIAGINLGKSVATSSAFYSSPRNDINYIIMILFLTVICLFVTVLPGVSADGDRENDDSVAVPPSSHTDSNSTQLHTAPEPLTCKSITYKDIMTDHIHMHRISLSAFPNFDSLSRLNSTEKQRKFTCIPRNSTENETEVRQVQLVSSADLQQALGSRNESSGVCSVVLFYAPWCPFCAQVAPLFYALARVFPQMNTFAIDAVHFSKYVQTVLKMKVGWCCLWYAFSVKRW